MRQNIRKSYFKRGQNMTHYLHAVKQAMKLLFVNDTIIADIHKHLPSSHERAEAQQNSTKKHPTQSRVEWRVRGMQRERPSIPPLHPKQNQALPGTCPRNAALGG